MVIKELLNVSISGLGRLHKTSIFPCGIFQCMKGVNRKEGDPNYDLFKLALRSTAQRLYPNYANVDWSGNAGYDVNDPKTYFSTMGCRTANGWDVNGMGQTKDGRGNICPVTIILPTLAMQAKERYMCEYDDSVVDVFMDILDTKIHEAKDTLLERFEWICSQNPESAKFMYENGVMAGYIPEEGIRSALRHGTLAIGQLGLAEALQILIGCNHTSQKGMEVAKRIEQLFKDRCAEFKNEYRLNFGVYYTPAENLCYTAMSKFKAKYGVIPNVSENEYFTNSIHVPVWEKIGVFEKIDIEAQLTGYSSAGCITYIELDSGAKNNIEALETMVNYAMDKEIVKAISLANEDVASVDPKNTIKAEVIATIATRLYERCRKRSRPTSVEEIQDMVETELMKERAYEVARTYVKYRYRQSIARDKYNDLMDAITEKMQAKNVQNQNANLDEKSFGGRIGEATNLMMRQYALDYCMTEKSKRNHLNNEIYIHDLDAYAVGSHNCLSIPFDKLLAEGFNTRQTDVRPANSLNTAMQLVAVIFQLQSLQQFGGVSATHLDWTMVPYVRKSFYKHYVDGVKYIDKREIDYSLQPYLPIDDEDYKAYSPEAYAYAMEMTEKECHQSVEALYHNLNTLQSRSGNQLN